MKVKVSLHLHTTEDINEKYPIDYSIFDLIDLSVKNGLKVLALTGHENCATTAKMVKYAAEKGVLLISGIELEIEGGHVLALNIDKSAEAVDSFDKLRQYKKTHPQCFVIAVHPNFKFHSIGLENLQKYRDLFDAVEHSWFYSRWIDLNLRTAQLAKKINLPMIATSDLHTPEYFTTDYAILEVKELTIPAVFEAISKGKIENVSRPKKLSEMIGFELKTMSEKIKYSFKTLVGKD
jgi:predicted metal-dependent phosphoesterase TrpH